MITTLPAEGIIPGSARVGRAESGGVAAMVRGVECDAGRVLEAKIGVGSDSDVCWAVAAEFTDGELKPLQSMVTVNAKPTAPVNPYRHVRTGLIARLSTIRSHQLTCGAVAASRR